MITVLYGFGFEPCRIQARIGLGHAKTGFVRAGDQRRQPAAFLLVGAEYDDGIQAEDIHVDRRRARHAGARCGDRLHHERGFDDTETGAAVLLRHGDAEPAVARERLMKIVREAAIAVFFQPIIGVKAGADFFDGCANRELLWRKREVHEWLNPSRG